MCSILAAHEKDKHILSQKTKEKRLCKVELLQIRKAINIPMVDVEKFQLYSMQKLEKKLTSRKKQNYMLMENN